METTNVQALIKDIKENLKQKSASKRDEVAVMKAMLNDTSFQVTDYATGESHCPATEYREMLSNVVSATTKITKAEASTLVAGYEAKKSDAETMVALSKDFINGALRTGRKVNLGATEKSNISIQLKEIPESEKKFPMKTGVNDDGTPRYEKAQTIIPAH
jgi:hypothetical protein